MGLIVIGVVPLEISRADHETSRPPTSRERREPIDCSGEGDLPAAHRLGSITVEPPHLVRPRLAWVWETLTRLERSKSYARVCTSPRCSVD
jgi:hypothetical protein